MQTMIVDQLVGQIVGKQGQYRVERLLGQSRLNAVYLARSLHDQRMLALTLYITPEHFAPDAYQRFMQRFTSAAPALVALQHPHILPVYESGEQYGYPYFLTPYLTHGSLADLLRQRQRFSYEEVFDWLEQIVPAIQLAHNRGLVHGTLKPANLVLNDDQQVLVAGFGLMHVLQLSGILQSRLPYAHLLSLAETFLAAPEYLAPEVVEGRSIDKRSDIYALGCILFELLCGTPPFKGDDPLTVAQMHVQQPLPSLRALAPELPVALVSVVHQALERDPRRRFQQVSDLLEAFAQVLNGVTSPRHSSMTRTLPAESPFQDTPAAVSVPTNWQLKPPIVTGKIPAALPPKQSVPVAKQSTPARPASPPATGPVAAWPPSPALPPVRFEPPAPPLARVEGMVPPPQPSAPPFAQELPPPVVRVSPPQSPYEEQLRANPPADNAWWLQTQEPGYLSTEARPSSRQSAKRPGNPAPRRGRTPQKRSSGPSRRQVLALTATGGVIAAGAFFASKLPALHLGATAMTPAAANVPTQPQKNASPSPSAPKQQMATPKSTQKMPTHMGTVVGSSTLSTNNAQAFLDPADGKGSLLIHLSNGNFVAYKQACTHEMVAVSYDSGTHTLICPAHGAIFDPANNGKVLQGPATKPLPMVAIRVNGDGTITTA